MLRQAFFHGLRKVVRVNADDRVFGVREAEADELFGPGGPGDVNTNPGWVRAEWTLASLGLVPTAQVRVRFIAGDADPGSLVEAAIDDFAIVSLLCVDPAPTCPPDFNGDGTLDPDDLADYISAFFSQPPAPGSDFNHDGLSDPDDLADYISAYF